jgi:formylglycine-generating enzyme required for sulfatase activity
MTDLKSVGKYELLEEIGRGGFAVVYKARDTELERVVALKVLHPYWSEDPGFAARFRREARAAANLRHPNIITVYEAGEAGGQFYIAMEYLPGRTLRELLVTEGALSLEWALPILEQVADALDYAHKQGVIHRDVKPVNVMIEETERGVRATLMDFGLVKALEGSAALTSQGTLLGSPEYMAPEQADPGRAAEIGPATDRYALGILAYQALTGRVPFAGNTPSTLVAHLQKAPPDPCTLNPTLESNVAAVVLKAIEKSPAERFQSAGELARALRQVAESRARQHVQQQELAQLLDKAQAARQTRDWLALQDLCVKVMHLDRTHPDALTMMLEASEGLRREGAEEAARRERGRRYEEGERAIAAGQWQAAIAAFEEVTQGNPDFKDVQAKLAQARDELQRAQWYDEAIAHAEAKRWAQACRTWVQVLRRRQDYHGGDAALRLLEAVEGALVQLGTAQTELEQAGGERDSLRARVAELEASLNQAQAALKTLESKSAKLDSAFKTAVNQAETYDRLLVAIEGRESEQMLSLSQELARGKLAGATRLLAQLEAEAKVRAPLSKVQGDHRISRKDRKEMVRVPAGEFLYGDDKKKIELPEFWIDKTPVTHAEYKRFLDANPKHPVPFVEADSAKPYNWDKKTRSFPKDKADHPVVLVSWEDATAYAKWAGKRLPTEEEWEKAARGERGNEWPWGNEFDRTKCNSEEDSTTPVGAYSPQGDSPFGAADMAGNVWEWTASEYTSGRKVLRGGSWSNDRAYARVTYRYLDVTPDLRYNNVGFRCVGVGPGGNH